MRTVALFLLGIVAVGCAKVNKSEGNSKPASSEQPIMEIPDTLAAKSIRSQEPDRVAKFMGALDHTNYDFWDRRVRSLQPQPEQVVAYLRTFDARFLPLIDEELFAAVPKIRTTSWEAVLAWYQEIDPRRAVSVFTKAFHQRDPKDDFHRIILETIASTGGSGFIPMLGELRANSSDAYTRSLTFNALIHLRDPRLRKEIETRLEDPNLSQKEREELSRAIEVYNEKSRDP